MGAVFFVHITIKIVFFGTKWFKIKSLNTKYTIFKL